MYILAASLFVLLAAALPREAYANPVHAPVPRPLVLWHGLGDSHSSPGMLEFMDLIRGVHPGIYIHSVYIEHNLDADQRAGFYGNLHEQLAFVSDQLRDQDELQGGFDAIGFSQGGQFLRAYVEQYNSPPVNNLITFGSQHMGIADLPLCRPGDLLCQVARNAARSGVYNTWAQRNLIQAQYFRDPDRLAQYYEHNTFLPAINNELPISRNQTHFDNLISLSNLVLVIFTQDKTVVPKESSWFGSYAPPTDEFLGLSRSGHGTVCREPQANKKATAKALPWDDDKEIIPMRAHPIYIEDWIGLRTLDKAGRLVLESCEGEHMQLIDECWQPLVERYVGELIDQPDRSAGVLRVQQW